MRVLFVSSLLATFGALAVAQSSPPSFAYSGCSVDRTGYLLATGYPASSQYHYVAIPETTSSPAEFCVAACADKGTLFAAVTNSVTCTCGIHHHSENDTTEGFCRPSSCSAGSQYPCGAEGYAAVFKIQPTACPTDTTGQYYQHGASCYRFEGNNNLAANWTSAKAACEAEGSRLVTIENGHENSFVLSLPNYINDANIDADFWAGGIYYGAASGFEWVTGRLPSYFDWKENEPSVGTIGQHCLELATIHATPYDGSWAAKNCAAKKPYMCKRFVNSTGLHALLPRVQVVNVGADTACVPPSNVYLDHTHTLQAWFTFDNTTVDTVSNTASDSSHYARTAAFHFYNDLPEYHFTHNPASFSDSLRFDGNFTAVLPAGVDGGFQNAVSLTAWVRPSRQANGTRMAEVIISKGMNNEPHSPRGVLYAYALYILNNEQYCFAVGDKQACTARGHTSFTFGRFSFVAGVYDGRTLTLYVDGVQAASVSGAGGYIHHNESTPIVIGGQSAPMNWSSRVTFEGHLDDVRVYSAAITIADIQYLEICALSPVLRNRIDAYVGTDLQLVLMGHDLNSQQRVGLSTVGCANGTAIDTAAFPPVYARGYQTTRVSVAFPGNQLTTSADYDICFATTNSPDAFEGGFNLTLRVVQITGLNGGLKKVEIDTDSVGNHSWIATSIEVNGVNLHDRTHVVVSPFRSCNYHFGNTVVSLNETSADGTSGRLYLNHAPINNEFYYVCWAGSREDGETAQRLVPTGLIIEFTGARYTSKLVASNDGTTAVNADNIISGFALGNGNYFMDCNSLNDTADHYFLKVEMGDFVDYIIPAPRHTACDVLLGQYWTNAFTGDSSLYLAAFHSPINPLMPNYDAAMTRPIPAGSFGALGGSASGFPLDGRTQLTQWGSQHGSLVGGCCHSVVHQERTWDQAYTITAHLYNNNDTYFQVDERPSVVFPGEIFSIRPKLVDIHGFHRNVTGGCVFTLNQDGVETSHLSHHCDHTFHVNMSSASSHFRVSVALAEPENTRYTIISRLTDVFTVTTTARPHDSHVLQSGVNITSLLSFREAAGIQSVLYVADHGLLMNLFEPSDASIAPQEGQPMTAHDYLGTPSASYTWYWNRVTSAEGLFGGVANAHGVQYFAFAFYLTVHQRVAFHGGCIAYMFTRDFKPTHRACAMFIDGVQLVKEEEFYSAGWHQVVIKLVNKEATTQSEGFWLNMEGSGVAFSVEKPLGAPNGATSLLPGGFISEFLTLRTNPFIADSINENGLPNGETDMTALPAQDGDWWPLDAPIGGAVIAAPRTMQAYQLAIFYYASALYATSAGSAIFEIPNALGAFRVFHHHQLVADFPADANGPTRYITLHFTHGGWSQLLIKATAHAGATWTFKMTAHTLDSVALFEMPSIPETVPAGAVSFSTRPVGEAIALLTQGSAQYNFPFDSTSTTDAAAVDPTYTQVDVTGTYKSGDISTIGGIPYVWTPVNALDTKTGKFSHSGVDGGGYNRYFSFAMWVSRDSATVNATVHHDDGAAVWVDGQYINGHASKGAEGGMGIHMKNVQRGWHTVNVRLQAENSLRFVEIPYADHDTAKTTCSRNGLSLCHRDSDVCVVNRPRVDIGIPLSGVHWAALGMDNEWIQIGSGTEANPVCGTELGDSSMRGVDGTFYAACCGIVQPAFFSFNVVASENRSHVAWAPAIPPAAVRMPTITYAQSSTSRTGLIVTITAQDPAAQILYTVSPRLYPSQVYSGPFEVELFGLVRAIARVNGVDSEIRDVIVRVHGNTTASRHSCAPHVDCFIQVGHSFEPDAVLAGRLFVAVDTSSDATGTALENVVSSSAYVADGNPNTDGFTSFLAADSNNVIRIPASFLKGSVSQFNIVEFEPIASAIDIRGVALQRPFTVTAITTAATSVLRSVEYSPISLSGGFVGGDRITFPELYLDPAALQSEYPGLEICSQKVCDIIGSKVAMAFHRLHFVGHDTAFVNSTHIHAASLSSVSCGCLESQGGLTVPFNAYATYAQPMLFKFATAVPLADVPAQSSDKSAEIYTFGPRVVSAFHTEDPSNENALLLARGLDNRVYITGNFPSTNVADYAVVFSCANGTTGTTVPFHCSQSVPNARIAGITNGVMTLHVHAPKRGHNIGGLWTLRLSRSSTAVNVPLNYDRDFFIAVLPPQPTITTANGYCAHDSTRCHNSSVITFMGTNFNTEQIHHNKVDLIDETSMMVSNKVFCHVMAATETQLECELIFASAMAANSAVDVIMRVEAVPAPRHSGEVFASAVYNTRASLVFHSPGVQGWSGNLDPQPIPPTNAPTSPTNAPSSGGGDGGSNAGIIAAVVCGVVVVAFIIGAIIVVTKFDLIPKKRSSNEMREVEESLNETYNPEKETV